MYEELRDVASGLVGAEGGDVHINVHHLNYLKEQGHELQGVGTGGGKLVPIRDFLKAVRALRSSQSDPLAEQVRRDPNDLDGMDFLSDQARDSLEAIGLTSRSAIAAFMENADNDITTLKGIGDGTAQKLLEAVTRVRS